MNTELYAELKRAGWVGGPLVRDCESELMDLLRKTDALMRARETALNADVRDAQAQLEMKQQETQVKAALLERTNKEVHVLKQKVRELERSNNHVTSGYQQQLSTLQDQLKRITQEHERFRKQYSEKSREKTLELQTKNDKLERVSAQLEEYKQKCHDLEYERGRTQKQMEALQSQNKTLSEKCDLIQHQSCSYQNQLDRRRDMLDSTETSLRAQISQLEGQLTRTKGNYNSQELQLQKLRGMYDELLSDQRNTLQEKEHLEAELNQATSTIRNLQSELSQTQRDLSVCSDQAGVNTKNQRRIQDEVHRLEQVLADREADTRKQRETERRLRNEIEDLQAKLNSTQSHATASRDQNKSREAENHASEIEQLKQQLEKERETHAFELDTTRRQITHPQEHDHATTRRDVIQHDASSQNMPTPDHSRTDSNDQSDRKTAELKVANAQLEALRLENRHLRQASHYLNDLDVTHAQKNLKDLETAYSSSLGALQEENDKLRDDVEAYKRQMRDVRDKSYEAAQSSQRKEWDQLLKNDTRERFETNAKEKMYPATETDVQALIGQVRESSAARVSEIDRNHQGALNQYNERVRLLETQVNELQLLLAQKNNFLQKLGLERDVMTQFVGDVDQLIQKPPRREQSSVLLDSRRSTPRTDDSRRSTPRDDETRNTLDPPDFYDDDNPLEDSVEAATARFLAEQEERTKQLEERLNAHIEQLKADTDRNTS